MQEYINKRGKAPLVSFFYIAVVDIITFLLMEVIDVYTIVYLIKIFLVAFNIYEFYYLFLSVTLNYVIDDEAVYIKGLLGIKNVKIPFIEIEGYKDSKGLINGVKLFGTGKNKFAFGRSVLNKIGITRMFVTNSEEVIYLKTEEINYAISPEESEKFKKALQERNIEHVDWEHKPDRTVSLHKQKKFMIPFIFVSAIIMLSIITPLVLYLNQMFPSEMPLNFNSKFEAIKMGTGKQFAFKQMIYGALNMGILFCMYYAAHFHVKYDKNTAHRYIYVSMIVSVAFFLMQVKTLIDYL